MSILSAFLMRRTRGCAEATRPRLGATRTPAPSARNCLRCMEDSQWGGGRTGTSLVIRTGEFETLRRVRARLGFRAAVGRGRAHPPSPREHALDAMPP